MLREIPSMMTNFHLEYLAVILFDLNKNCHSLTMLSVLIGKWPCKRGMAIELN